MSIKLENISDARHEERANEYARNLGIHKFPDFDRDMRILEQARALATAEMLDEIHAMLRHLVSEQEDITEVLPTLEENESNH